MKTHCPYCHSQRVQYTQTTKPDVSLLSPASLSALGISLSKTLNIPPVIGGLLGAVIGGLVIELTNNKPLTITHQPQGFCMDCQRWFN